jgi:hypothetical protein
VSKPTARLTDPHRKSTDCKKKKIDASLSILDSIANLVDIFEQADVIRLDEVVDSPGIYGFELGRQTVTCVERSANKIDSWSDGILSQLLHRCLANPTCASDNDSNNARRDVRGNVLVGRDDGI